MLTVRLPEGYAPEREYAVRVLLEEFLGLAVDVRVDGEQFVQISDGERRVTVRDGLFATPTADWLRERSLPTLPLQQLTLAGTPFAAHPEAEIPVLYGTPSWQRSRDTLELGVDVFGSAFFLLTRYEELVLDALDEHERFPASANLTVRAGLARRPLVNEYLELLWLALRMQWPRLTRRRLDHAVLPSHDVDWPLAAERSWGGMLRRAAADAIVRRDPVLSARRAAGHAARALGRNALDVNNTFDAIMDAGEREGVRSCFYFIAGRRAGLIDGDYSLDDPWIRALLRRIHARGHEIGLHASYTTFLDPEQTRRERETLGRALDEEGIDQEHVGSRQHFLRWRNPQTWRNCDEAGLAYDTTIGFAEDVGFRAGVCLDYPVFDLERRRTLSLRERPLVVMDGPVLDRLGLSREETAVTIDGLRQTCARYGGLFTLLWHNSRLVRRAERRLYVSSLSSPNSGSVRATIDSQE